MLIEHGHVLRRSNLISREKCLDVRLEALSSSHGIPEFVKNVLGDEFEMHICVIATASL